MEALRVMMLSAVLSMFVGTLSGISVFLFFGLQIRYGDLAKDCDPNDWLVKLWRKKPKKYIKPRAWFPD